MDLNMEGDVECKKCCVLKTEMEEKVTQAEQTNTQQLTAYLMLKQKIISTDKMIQEYQSSKAESELLSRKNAEFAQLIDQLHRDLSARSQECSTMRQEMDPLKKANADYKAQAQAAKKEAEKWKYEVDANKHFTNQLVAKVKDLEKFEEEVKTLSNKVKEHEKVEKKIKQLKDQNKEAKDTSTKIQKELKKMQKDQKLMTKYALTWAKVADSHGKLNSYQKRFYEKLKSSNSNTDENCDDDDEDQGDLEETDAQSKLLEQMLTDELESDAQEIVSTPAKAMPTTPKAKRTPVAKTPTRGVSSSPRTRSSERNRTPIYTPTTRSKRARLSESAGETSITPMSLGIFELKSHKESDTLCDEREELRGEPYSSPLNEELSAGAEPLIDVNQDENDKPETLQGATSQSYCGGKEALPRKAKRGRPRKNIIKKAPSPLPTTQSEQEDQSTIPLLALNIPDVNKNICLPTSPKSTETQTSTANTAQPSTNESIERQDDDAPSTQSEPEVNEPPPPNVEDEQPERKEENETLQESAPIEIADDVLKTPVTVEQTSDVSSQELESGPEVNPSKSPARQTQKTMDEEPSDVKEADEKSEETNSMFSIDDSLTLPTLSTEKSNESTIIDNAEPENEGPTVDPCSKNVECQDKEVTRPTEPETASAVQPKSPVAIQHSSIIPQVQQFNNTAQHVHPTNQAAFKVPRVPPLLDATKNSIPVRPTPDPRWTQKFVPASCNEQKDDDELVSILQNIRTNLIKVPRVVSPLATTPEPVPEPVEPKFRFPVLPRCAFNWSAKKIPITNGLNERLGAYLHPGVTVRVRFRRVGALKDIRSPDILCCTIRDVANFAEAERRPRPVVMINSPPMTRSESPFEKQELTIEEESRKQKRSRNNNIPTLTSLRPNEDNKKSKLPNAPNQPDDCTIKRKAHRKTGNPHLPQAQSVKSSKPMQKETEDLPSSDKRSTTVLFGSSSSSSSSSDSEPEEVTITISSATLPPPHLVKEIPIRPLPSRQPLPSNPFHTAALSLKNRPNRLAIRPIDPSSALVRTATYRPTPSPVSQQPATESITCSKSVGKTRVLPPPRRSSQDSTMPYVTDTVAPLSEPLPEDANLPQQNAKKRIARSSKRGLGSDSDSPSSEVTSVAKKRKQKDDGQQARPLPPSMGLSPARAVPKSPLSSSSLTESPTSGVLTRSRMAKLGTGTELVLAAPTPVTPNQPSKRKKVLKNRLAQQSSEQEEIIEASIEEPAAKEHPSKLNKVLDNTVTQQPIDQQETSIEEPAAKEDKLEKTVEPSVFSTNDDSQLPSSLPVTSQSEDKFPSSSITRDDSILLPSCDEPSSPSSPMSAPPSVTEEPEPLEEEREEPATFEVYDTPQSPSNESLLEPTEKALEKDPLTAIIPTSRVEDTKLNLSAFELISSKSVNTPAPAKKPSKKIKAHVHAVINKVLKTEQVTAETMAACVERVTWPQNQEHPEVFIRQLMSSIIKSSDSLLDLSMTPPAPPLTVVQQRCVALLKAVDLKNKELKVAADYDPNLYCNYFLNEICHLMFQPLSKLTLVEMNALARTYTAVCRSRGMLQRARVFLFDCLYWLQPRSYSLTYTILSIWTEVLRPVSFPFGLTCTDRTIAYLLLNCCRVEGVRGLEGKVLQVRQLLQTILGYKDVPVNTVDELVTHLMQRLSETKSVDEATSLSWNLSLLARWEGNAWAINIIEKQLWPFLQKWSTGQSSNAAAAAAISCIGLLAKYVTTQQRNAIKTVLTALKVILQSGEACSAVEEAAAESIILLGEKDEPEAIFQIVKNWKPANGIISERLQTILHLFFQRHSVSTV